MTNGYQWAHTSQSSIQQITLDVTEIGNHLLVDVPDLITLKFRRDVTWRDVTWAWRASRGESDTQWLVRSTLCTCYRCVATCHNSWIVSALVQSRCCSWWLHWCLGSTRHKPQATHVVPVVMNANREAHLRQQNPSRTTRDASARSQENQGYNQQIFDTPKPYAVSPITPTILSSDEANPD